MRFSRCLCSVMRAAALAAVLSAAIAPLALARPRPKPGTGFRLFAGATAFFSANRVQCRLLSVGELCRSLSTTVGGATWPKGSADQYIFAGGLQVGGIIDPTQPKSVNGFAGDTAGAFFYNTSGSSNGLALRPIFASTDAADAAIWPAEARVPCSDPATTTIPGGLPPETIARCSANGVGGDPTGDLYDPALQGALAASQGDNWFVYWEGDPSNNASRTHPLGILVETRALGWNFPSGNEDILYFVHTFYNITSANPDDYNGIRASIRPFIQQKGRDFQALNVAKYGIALPVGGYIVRDIFVDVVNDMDVANFNANYSGVNVPFALGYTYVNVFDQAPGLGWTFDPAIFGSAPFFPGVGFVGVKYLSSPINPLTQQQVGLTLFGTFSNTAGALPDPNDDKQLYRYMTGNLLPTDGACSPGLDPAVDHICNVNLDTPTDMRFYQASGPFDLGPGQFGSIVVAYIFAPPVADGNCPSPACDVKPADNGDPGRLTILGDPVRMTAGVNQVDRMTGYLSFNDANNDGEVTQTEFVVQSGSLLGKSLVAQTVFDSRFLLPFSPTAPEFFLVPGDNQVTVLWRPSETETNPDPFFAVAGNPLTPTGGVNPLYDPNFRALDVEGYRIYRGRTANPSQLTLVAQFDYAPDPATGRGILKDFLGTVNPVPGCAPELAVFAGCDTTAAGLPILQPPPPPGTAFTASVDVDLAGTITQVIRGDRVLLADSNAQILPGKLDTAFADISRGRLGVGVSTLLANNGVPFAFVDPTARNSVRYFYSVTAFDINSRSSGPSSLESARLTKAATPVAAPTNVQLPELAFGIFGDDGTNLGEQEVVFTIDAATGRFNGTPPPTAVAQVQAAFAPLIPALLPALSLEAAIDSVLPRSIECPPALQNFRGFCVEFFVTFNREGQAPQTFRTLAAWPFWANATATGEASPTAEALLGSFPVSPDEASAARYGIPPGSASFNAAVQATLSENIRFSAQENQQSRRLLGRFSPGGSRWFDGANETVDDPAYSIRVGHVAGVDSIWTPLSHTDQDPVTPGLQEPADENACMQLPPHFLAPMGRQADIELTWGDAGAVASVRDITHHLDVPFKAVPQASWGFVTDGNGNGKIDWVDFAHTPGVEQAVHTFDGAGFCGGLELIPAIAGNPLVQTATVTPVSFTANIATGDEDPAGFVTGGQGFGLYINGQQFIFGLTGGALPAAGTKWTLRMYSGVVRAATGAETTNPDGYTYSAAPASPAIPGLKVVFNVPAATQSVAATRGDLSRVHTVPDPYYVRSRFEVSTDQKILKFVNLPQDAIIRIYSASGVLVRILEHHAGNYSPTSISQGSEIQWDLRNRNNQVVASGVYFYHIEAGDARRVGRFTVVNFAQ